MYGVSEWVVSPAPAAQPEAVLPRDGEQWRTMFSSSGEVSSGVTVSPRTTLGYPPFWRGVNLIANGVSKLPANVFRRSGDDREIDDSHPAQRLVRSRVSPIMIAAKLRQVLQAHALVHGNGFAWIGRDARQRPTELWVLNPQEMVIRYVDEQLWYITRIGGEAVRFPGRDVLHIKGLSHDGIQGYSVVSLMAEALGVGMAAQKFGGKFFGNGSNSSGILMVPGHFPPDKIRNTLEAWDQMNTGMERAHKVALLQDGVKYQPFTIAPEQAQFLQTRDFEVRSTVANILGVPPHLLGDDTRTSHSSLEQENQSYLDHTLDPWLHEWETELSAKLLSTQEQEQRTHFVEFNREAAVSMEFGKRIAGYRLQLETGLQTVNEVRRRMNMPSIGDEGDVRYRPANWLEVGEEDQAPAAPPPIPQPDPDPDEEDDSGDESADGDEPLDRLVRAEVLHACEIERRRVTQATNNSTKYLAFLDEFYGRWVERTLHALEMPELREIKQSYAEQSKSLLLDVCGACTAETLPAQIADCVAGWDDRSESLAAELREAIRCRSK